MARNPKVIIVDHSIEECSELHKMLSFAHIAVLGEAGYGVEAHTLVEDVQPDAVLIGIMDSPRVRASSSRRTRACTCSSCAAPSTWSTPTATTGL
jgi:AmiR/NasT family two-component response regulator